MCVLPERLVAFKWTARVSLSVLTITGAKSFDRSTKGFLVASQLFMKRGFFLFTWRYFGGALQQMRPNDAFF